MIINQLMIQLSGKKRNTARVLHRYGKILSPQIFRTALASLGLYKTFSGLIFSHIDAKRGQYFLTTNSSGALYVCICYGQCGKFEHCAQLPGQLCTITGQCK